MNRRACRRAARIARSSRAAPSVPNAVRVGSKNFTESFVIAEIYAQALERAGMRVERLFNLGSTQIAMAAMERGNIDLYPEYTGTALIDVLHLAADRRSAQGVRGRRARVRAALRHRLARPVADERLAGARDDPRASPRQSVSPRSPTSRAPRRSCASQRFRSFSRVRTGCPGCSASTAAFASRRCARTTSR